MFVKKCMDKYIPYYLYFCSILYGESTSHEKEKFFAYMQYMSNYIIENICMMNAI